jgi:hypothetical protein
MDEQDGQDRTSRDERSGLRIAFILCILFIRVKSFLAMVCLWHCRAVFLCASDLCALRVSMANSPIQWLHGILWASPSRKPTT